MRIHSRPPDDILARLQVTGIEKQPASWAAATGRGAAESVTSTAPRLARPNGGVVTIRRCPLTSSLQALGC
ncbi:hypothetical protein [Ruania alba]|uniref:hypothetical protein n=1 Tax=Ruania alba TaxID=648782 RepID=UPI000B8029B9|nr:hypothetical protein [Ruania alba]